MPTPQVRLLSHRKIIHDMRMYWKQLWNLTFMLDCKTIYLLTLCVYWSYTEGKMNFTELSCWCWSFIWYSNKYCDRRLSSIDKLGRSITARSCWWYYSVIMSTMASQVTSLTIVYWTISSGAEKEIIKAPRHWPLWWWIPRTKGQ